MTAGVEQAPKTAPIRGFKLAVATLAVSLGTLLITLDQFIANVSIPTISGNLGVSVDNGTWVVTSYTIANAIVIPLTGWLSSLLGRVRLFAFSAILFAFVSLLCGLSVSFPMLLIFRFLQGAVSGSLIPLSQALLLSLHPSRKGFALGIWGLVIMVGPALGPVLGGWITYNYSWGWIFNINVPIGILAGALSYFLLQPIESKREKRAIDLIGILLVAVAVLSFQVVLDRGNDDDWWHSNFIRTLTVISFISFCFFLVWEYFHHDPVVDLSFFKSRNFLLGTLILGISVFLIFGSVIVGPIWAQAQLGYTPLWAGYSIAPLGLSALVVFPLVGIYSQKLDPRIWAAVAFIILSMTCFALSELTIHTSFSLLAFPRFIQGFGFAMFFVPITAISLAGIPEDRLASAAGVFTFIRMLFISSGVSLWTTYFSRRENFFQSRYVESVIPSNPQFSQYYQALSESIGLEGLHADAFTYRMVQNQASTETFLEINYIQGFIFLCLLLLLLLFRCPKEHKRARETPIGVE